MWGGGPGKPRLYGRLAEKEHAVARGACPLEDDGGSTDVNRLAFAGPEDRSVRQAPAPVERRVELVEPTPVFSVT